MDAWLGLGSNQQGSVAQLTKALTRLQKAAGIEIRETSSFYRTPPWGDEQQDDFINAVVRIDTCFEPEPLLSILQSIETEMGRQRTQRRWGPRLIDLDLLLVGDRLIQTAELELPHPRMHQRAFVLLPISELNANLEVPGRGRVGELLEKLDCKGIIRLPVPGFGVNRDV